MDIQQSTSSNSLKSVLSYFVLYFKNPLLALKNVPNWNLLHLIIIQVCFSILIGFISDQLTEFILIKGIFFFPISSVVTTLLGAGFFYFLFLVIFNTEVSFIRLYTIVFLSHIPFLILRLFKVWIAPIELIGFMATSALLTVGFVENFQFPKKKMIRIVGALFAVYLAAWIAQQISLSKKSVDARKHLDTDTELEQSVDQIQKELDF